MSRKTSKVEAIAMDEYELEGKEHVCRIHTQSVYMNALVHIAIWRCTNQTFRYISLNQERKWG